MQKTKAPRTSKFLAKKRPVSAVKPAARDANKATPKEATKPQTGNKLAALKKANEQHMALLHLKAACTIQRWWRRIRKTRFQHEIEVSKKKLQTLQSLKQGLLSQKSCYQPQPAKEIFNIFAVDDEPQGKKN